MKSKKTTKNYADIIRGKLANDTQLAREVEEERLHADIAVQILRLRTDAKMEQKELAERVGTQQSVISRIEEADYNVHSLQLLNRIADVFGKRLHVDFRDPPTV
jgi:ribosome-binding protein aMBF1 (putative translation factor)